LRELSALFLNSVLNGLRAYPELDFFTNKARLLSDSLAFLRFVRGP